MQEDGNQRAWPEFAQFLSEFDGTSPEKCARDPQSINQCRRMLTLGDHRRNYSSTAPRARLPPRLQIFSGRTNVSQLHKKEITEHVKSVADSAGLRAS